MTELAFTLVPEPLKLAHDFIESTNESRLQGIEVDSAQILAAKVANVAMRSYFARLVDVIERGEFDPDAILQVEMAMGGSYQKDEYDDDHTG